MNGKVKLVLFDLDNTILDFSKIEEYSLKKTFLKYSISINEEDVRKYREINKEEWGKYENGLQSKEETTLNRFMAFSDYLGKEFPTEDVNRRYLESLTDEVYFVENAESTLIGIDRLGVEMGLLTNGVKRIQEKRFEKAALGRFFKHVLTSEEAGVAKPDTRIFDMIVNLFGVDRGETIFVGDSFDSDIVGASRSGMLPLWYVPDGTENEDGISDKYADEKIIYKKIKDLKEVLDFLR